mmetsp:Transcript_56102/g.167910  ORF Transcript_56102/g.167910 Transcript_56102/m.167910 type:complete len:234 (-) Transcript_56102:1483-2184(-)
MSSLAKLLSSCPFSSSFSCPSSLHYPPHQRHYYSLPPISRLPVQPRHCPHLLPPPTGTPPATPLYTTLHAIPCTFRRATRTAARPPRRSPSSSPPTSFDKRRIRWGGTLADRDDHAPPRPKWMGRGLRTGGGRVGRGRAGRRRRGGGADEGIRSHPLPQRCCSSTRQRKRTHCRWPGRAGGEHLNGASGMPPPEVRGWISTLGLSLIPTPTRLMSPPPVPCTRRPPPRHRSRS